MMHSLYDRPDPIPTLYVRSLSSSVGPEYSIKQIFSKARNQAPCCLVFEDLDSIVSDYIRSYFLNEVDGLQENDGILMVGSTNHLERLDPGISKRPSRFDRKYLFPDPNMGQRVQYCEYWREKLQDNEDIEFPEKLNKAIASITKGFSFAYIQEAFVAALLAIANAGEEEEEDEEEKHASHGWCMDDERSKGAVVPQLTYHSDLTSCPAWYHAHCWDNIGALEGEDGDLDRYVLWREMKKVVKTLREELDQGKGVS